ncbi:UNVERIFIED_CONTAM: hypothetical protein Slati_3274200 [Sesamum latifolium]|uniref:Uncharacterized protein n=1 Tax=Sesamum latifolium TaxID=2727402 RepID=A0AAW2V068_9LAMI
MNTKPKHWHALQERSITLSTPTQPLKYHCSDHTYTLSHRFPHSFLLPSLPHFSTHSKPPHRISAIPIPFHETKLTFLLKTILSAPTYILVVKMAIQLENLVESIKSKVRSLKKSKKPYVKMDKSASVKVEIRSRKARKLIDKTLKAADRPGKKQIP